MSFANKAVSLLKSLLKRLIAKNKSLIIQKGQFLNGFYALLFRQINTGEKWTKQEIAQLKRHLLHLSAYIPVLLIFLIPGGSLLLPFLAEILDRRKKVRKR